MSRINGNLAFGSELCELCLGELGMSLEEACLMRLQDRCVNHVIGEISSGIKGRK